MGSMLRFLFDYMPLHLRVLCPSFLGWIWTSTMAWYAFDRRLFVYLAIILIPFFILFRIHIYILTTTPA